VKLKLFSRAFVNKERTTDSQARGFNWGMRVRGDGYEEEKEKLDLFEGVLVVVLSLIRDPSQPVFAGGALQTSLAHRWREQKLLRKIG
jgi:hypothetical protein